MLDYPVARLSDREIPRFLGPPINSLARSYASIISLPPSFPRRSIYANVSNDCAAIARSTWTSDEFRYELHWIENSAENVADAVDRVIAISPNLVESGGTRASVSEDPARLCARSLSLSLLASPSLRLTRFNCRDRSREITLRCFVPLPPPPPPVLPASYASV